MVIAAIATAVLAIVVPGAVPASGVHWPMFGGDPGRSGFQPVDEGGVPARLEWRKVGTVDRDVRTSIVTTAGPLTEQRIVYGTDRGDLVVRRLLGGGFLNVTDLSAASDPFGFGLGSVSPVTTSTSAGPGQTFAVHNERYVVDHDGDPATAPVDRPGIQLAQINETTGTRTRDDIDIADSIGMRIESSPVLTPPDGAGTRNLFFVAAQVEGTSELLYKVTIANAASPAAAVTSVTRSADINAYPFASPTLVWLRASDGTPTLYVAVGTNNGLVTLRASDFAAGPAAPFLGQNVRTPSTPVTASGNAPGSPGSGVDVTPAIYATTVENLGTGGRVHRLTQTGNGQVLDVVSSAVIAGEPADGLMISHTFVYQGTRSGLFALDATTLAVNSSVSGSFRQTVPAGTGSIVATMEDDGDQLVLDHSTGALAPVVPDLFTQDATNADAQKAFGQPSISRGFLQFASDRGIYVYGLPTPPTGYWLVASDGGIFSYGDAEFFGSTGDIKLNKPIVGMAPTTSDRGYWLVASDGGIFNFGDAQFQGSTGDLVLNKPVVGMAPTPSGLGYWMVASDGGIFSFGDAPFLGSTGDIVLNQPIVGMAATPSGLGYWLVASDGGIFAFGDAVFHGSTGDIKLNKPIVGMTAATNNRGYWLVASDGGVFSFGTVGYFGSTGDIKLNSPIVAADSSATSAGYLFTAADGGVFQFGDAPYLGAAASLGRLNSPVVGMAAKP